MADEEHDNAEQGNEEEGRAGGEEVVEKPTELREFLSESWCSDA